MAGLNLLGASPQLFLSLAGIYIVYLITYRLFLHPLRKVPGPWLAGVTYWYEFYYDVIRDGNYVKQYPGLHEKYGPIVRASPDRVHIDNVDYFREVYRLGSKYYKDPDYYPRGGGVENSIIMLIDPEVHKDRYAVVKPLFSAKGVEPLAPVALRNISRLMEKMKASFEKGSPVDMTRLIRLLTIDTIMVLLFNKNMNLLESEEEEPQFAGTMKMFADNFLVMKHFPLLARLSVMMPESLADKLVPGYVPFRKLSSKWIHDIENRQKHDDLDAVEGGRRTYFDLLLDANKSRGYRAFGEEVLVDEALAMCFAGTDTTSFALSLGTYHLLSNPSKLKVLREELDAVPANADGLLEYRDVRNLPYLTAVIKEILRISPPVPGIIPRRVPAGGATFAGYYLAAGTTVSSSIGMITHDPVLFSKPNTFLPERWLGDDSKDLEKWFLVFSRGSRACLGQNVAFLEFYVCFANLFRRFNMSLYKTDETTVQWKESAAARLCTNVKVTVDSLRE